MAQGFLCTRYTSILFKVIHSKPWSHHPCSDGGEGWVRRFLTPPITDHCQGSFRRGLAQSECTQVKSKSSSELSSLAGGNRLLAHVTVEDTGNKEHSLNDDCDNNWWSMLKEYCVGGCSCRRRCQTIGWMTKTKLSWKPRIWRRRPTSSSGMPSPP